MTSRSTKAPSDLADILISGVTGVTGVTALETKDISVTPAEMQGVAGVTGDEGRALHRLHLSAGHGVTRKPAENRHVTPVTPVTRNFGDALKEWDKGVGSLDLDTPLGGYPRDRWLRIIRDCNRLLNEFGKGAATMGWTTEDLFSFPVGGAASDDLGGLIWRLDGGRVVFMDEVRAAYRWPFSDQTSRFARGHIGALSGHRVPVWELAA